MNRRLYNLILGICFPLILAAVFIINIINPDKAFSSEENHMLQTMPQFSFSSYFQGRFENKLDEYANDQFLARNGFIRIKSAVDVTLGKLEANGVYLCKDNYLMEDIASPDSEELSRVYQALTDFKNRHQDLDMFFLLAPNAANVLSDKLPALVRPEDQNKYMDEFFAELGNLGITSIDVREALKTASETQQVYYRTDHHWTTDGAYAAFRSAAQTLGIAESVSYKSYVVKNDFCGTLASKSGFVSGLYDEIKVYLPEEDSPYLNSVIYYSDTRERTTNFYQLDNLDTKDAYTVFGGSNHSRYTIETPTESQEKLLLVKDSYANSMIPFLSQYYREIVVVDPRYFYDDLDSIIRDEGITQVLFLYNANTFFEDDSLSVILEKVSE